MTETMKNINAGRMFISKNEGVRIFIQGQLLIGFGSTGSFWMHNSYTVYSENPRYWTEVK